MSDSDDDVPLSRKVAVATKPAPAPAAKPAAKAVVVKKEVRTPPKVKKEPQSNGTAKVKKETKVKAEDDGAAPKKVREKKEFDLPGQTRETPPDTDPLRKFYHSLLQQRDGSAMARKWCVMHGLLPREEALDWLAQAGKIKSPSKENGRGVKRGAEPARGAKPPAKKVKAEAPKAKPKAAAKKPAAKKKAASSSEDEASDSDSDDDQPLARRVK